MAPNIMGNTKPPSPPARPTTPETAPILSGNSSEINLKTDALPMAVAIPTIKSNVVKIVGVRPIKKSRGPFTVMTVKLVCG